MLFLSFYLLKFIQMTGHRADVFRRYEQALPYISVKSNHFPLCTPPCIPTIVSGKVYVKHHHVLFFYTVYTYEYVKYTHAQHTHETGTEKEKKDKSAARFTSLLQAEPASHEYLHSAHSWKLSNIFWNHLKITLIEQDSNLESSIV